MTLLEQLEIKHAIFLAPMAGVSTPELAAEVSNQGALGSLGLGASTAEAARQQILTTQALTDQPFQVNFFCHQSAALNSQTAQQWIQHLRPQFAKYGAAPPEQLRCIY
ncbi:nitronate monooxygenase, partial [Acinetobacter sp.]